MEQQIQFSDDEDTIIEEKIESEEEEEDYWDEETRIRFMKASCESNQNIYEVFQKKPQKKVKKIKKIKKNNKILIPFGETINVDKFNNEKKKWKSDRLKKKNIDKKEYKFNPKLPPWDFK